MSGGIEIIFDLAIDGGAWPGPLAGRPAVAGEAWLGPLGLLDRLETELGLGGLHPSAVERGADLSAKLSARHGYWRPSYEVDPIGSCHRLLRDRDTLALWGWRGEPASQRLSELWTATEDALPGVPERLRAAHEALHTGRPDIDRITTMSPLADLPPAWTRLFAQLAATGVTLTESAPTRASSTGDLLHARTQSFSPAGDGGLVLLRPHGPLAAADEVAASLAQLPSLDGVVIVGGDDVLDAALARHHLPKLGASVRPPASTSLIRLVIEAAFEPMDPTDLHALLCLAPGPVPRRVAFELIKALGELPGRRSPAWRNALDKGLAACADDWRDDVRARLDVLLQPAAARDGEIKVVELEPRLDILAAWARARMAATPSLQPLTRLAAQARKLLNLRSTPTLSLMALRRLCDELGEGDGPAAPGEVGLASVSDPGAVLAPATTIVWWGFTRDRAPMPTRLRLSNRERDTLIQLGVTPPDHGWLMEGEAARWRRPLEMATHSLVLVCPTTDAAGEPSFVHPLWDELRATMPRPEEATKLETARLRLPAAAQRTTVAPRALPTPTVTLTTSAALAMRTPESPSSLERLLGCSLAWSLHYHGCLRTGGSTGPVAPGPLLYGKVAHHLLAEVFGPGALSAAEAASRAQNLVDTELAQLCESLALPHYQVERTALKQAIVQTARALGELLTTAGASVRGVEQAASGKLGAVAVAGRTDLLLEHPDVVIDLKWSGSTPRELLQAGAALQLAAYAELLASSGPRPQVAYLTLQDQALIGPPGATLPGLQTLGTATAQETLSGALVSLEQRQRELAQGVLTAPAADGTQLETELVAGHLVIAPACKFCSFSTLCGKRACR